MNKHIGAGLKTGTARGACDTHGAWEKQVIMLGDTPIGGDTCPRCVEEAAVAKERAAQAKTAAEQRAKLSMSLEAAGVGRLYWDASMDNFVADTADKRAALEACRTFVATCLNDVHDAPSMILWGKTGTGKTHLACAMVRDLLRHGVRARRVRMIDMIERIRAGWTEHRDGMAEFVTVQVLVIDEVGVQYGTDAEKVLVQTVIDKRYESVLPTIFVTNLGVKALREELTDRVMRRIRDSGGKDILFSWSSHGSVQP